MTKFARKTPQSDEEKRKFAARTVARARVCNDPLMRELNAILANQVGHIHDICAKAGIHHETVRTWIRGDRAPTTPNLVAVLNAFGYDLKIVPLRPARDQGGSNG